jgi:hypothetical protein
MADLSSIGAALASVKTLWELAKSAKDAQLAMKISAEVGNIQGQLIDVQQQILTIQQDNQILRHELDLIRDYQQHDSVVWRRKPESFEDGPFCPVCLSDGRETRLVVNPDLPPNPALFNLYCPKAHHESPHRLSKAPGPYFTVPRHLVPENYFFSSIPSSPRVS